MQPAPGSSFLGIMPERYPSVVAASLAKGNLQRFGVTLASTAQRLLHRFLQAISGEVLQSGLAQVWVDFGTGYIILIYVPNDKWLVTT